MSSKINKFRGILEFEIPGESIVLRSLKVNDLFDLLLLSRDKDNEFVRGVCLLTDLMKRSYPDEPLQEIEDFIVANYKNFLEQMMVALGWTTKEKLREVKQIKEVPKSKKGIASLKARAAMEVETNDIEDKYITTCYVIMREFKYTPKDILEMDATVFLIIIDEMNKQADKEKAEMDKSRRKK
jgi:hypothetical protein